MAIRLAGRRIIATVSVVIDGDIFENGSMTEWVDKETLRYTKGDFSVLVSPSRK